MTEAEEAHPDSCLRFFDAHIGQACPSRVNVEPHESDSFCLLQIVSGAGWHWSDQEGRQPLGETQVLLMPPKTSQDWGGAQEGVVVDRISFAGSLPTLLLAEGVAVPGIRNAMPRGLLLPLIRHVLAQGPQAHLLALGELTTLLTRLHSEGQPPSAESPSRLHSLLQQIQSSPERWWDCKAMAAYCHVSESQLRRIFKKETGVSPKLYLDQVKMKKACELLKKGFGVANVADLLGYADPFHFSRRFKAIQGVSPRDFLAQ